MNDELFMKRKERPVRNYSATHKPYELPLRYGTWVRADDPYRKPEDSTVYLVEIIGSSKDEIFDRSPAIASWFDDEGWVIDSAVPIEEYEVIRWTPLPPM